jgi:histidinol phosphatase-like PHP family hydrolase
MPKEIVTVVRADFHSHTLASDGAYSVEEMLVSAREKKLSIYAISDHNTTRGIAGLDDSEVFERFGVYFFKAFELSASTGHFVIVNVNPHSVEHILDKYAISEASVAAPLSKKDIQDILWYFKDQEALIICAHPLIPPGIMSTKKGELVELYNRGLIHGAEDHNHELMKKSGPLYKLWHRHVKDVLKHEGIPRFSNSDAHTKEDVGSMFNEYKNIPVAKVLYSLTHP